MKVGIFHSFMSPVSTVEVISEFGRRAENAGLDSIWLGEHVAVFDNMEFPYPGSRDGKLPVPEGWGMLDTVSCFAVLAAATKTLRMGTGISLVSQRNPLYTAKEFATLDWLTQGRMDFGIGVGWCKEEVLACGYGWEDRGERADEFLDLIKALWTEPVVTFHGKHASVTGCRMDPKPVQSPHIPIIVGGHSNVAFRRAARIGAGWFGFALSQELAGKAIKGVEVALADAGRSRDGFQFVIAPPGRPTPDMIKAYADLGVDRLVLLHGGSSAEKLLRGVDEMAPLVAAA